MDYEKAYKDALERARQWHDDSNITIGLKENLEDIFPELKENDERIRKDLIKAISTYTQFANRPSNEIIAWLEKQGEQKPAWSEEDEEMFKDCLVDLQFLIDNGRKCNKELYQNEIKWFKTIKDRIKPQPKQEWSDEDDETLTRIVFSFEEEMFPSKQECKKNIDFLNSLKDRVQPHWKPTQEQMEAFYWIKQYPAGEFAKKDILNSLYNDLKKL